MSQIEIKIAAYDPKRGNTTVYTCFTRAPVAVTGQEDSFAHGYDHARSFMAGLQAALAGGNIRFSVQSVTVGTHGSGCPEVDGVTIFEIESKAAKAAGEAG